LRSIRSRLLFWQISALLLTALLTGLLSYQFARHGFDQARDYGLQQIAESVMRHDETPLPTRTPKGNSDPSAVPEPSASGTDSSTDTLDETPGEPDEGQFVSQVWSEDGALIYSSLEDDGPPLQPTGYHQVAWQDQVWRTYTVARNLRTVQVAVSVLDRDQVFAELLPWVLLPTGMLVVILGLLIHEAVSRALRPLENLRRDIGDRAVSELHAVPTNDLPDEVAPLAHTLNQLLERLDQLLAGQRQFLADAAHELNTPLAAIKLQAQLARRARGDDREEAIDALDAGIERAIHLTAQLLQLARLEPDVREPELSRVQLDGIVRDAVIAFSPHADQRKSDLGLLQADPAQVRGDGHSLRVMLDNLIDNALRYSPEGARIDVSLRAENGQAVIEVGDNGPGIAPSERAQVLERFVRLHPAGTTGSGLGLAIVREIASQHGASLSLLDTPGGGLTVRVVLPLVQPTH
jgi:two-component system, OmpR family, sensor kinase